MSDDEHGGYPLGNPFRRRHEADDPLGATNETPVDLAAVQADDALLDMLGGAEVARGDADADLARVLVAWRRDIDLDPIGELVDSTTALTIVAAAYRPPTLVSRVSVGLLTAAVLATTVWLAVAILMLLVTR